MNQKIFLDKSYNERLFENGGLRSFLHNARFYWIRDRLGRESSPPESVFELGCFDGRLIDYLPVAPHRYLGFDADWEGGLSAAATRDFPDNIRFQKSGSADDLAEIQDDAFDIAVALETIEHINPSDVERYLAELARITKCRLYVTVPNEKGPIFLMKYLGKKLFFGGTQRYTAAEVVFASLGRLNRVERDDHKGFDYERLIEMIGRHFAIETVQPIPFRRLPVFLGFTIGIVAKKV